MFPMMISSAEKAECKMRIGFLGLLAIVLIALKLTGYIAWPWLWVLSPLWVNAIIFVLCLMIVAMFKVISHGKR